MAAHGMVMVDFCAFASADALAKQLASDVASALQTAIIQRGAASLVLSGGSTPVPFLEALGQQVLDWSRIHITLADERWVMPESPDSNEHLLRRFLPLEQAKFLSLAPIRESESLSDGAARITDALPSIPLPFDYVILGMGEDGHTASLFPHHAALHLQDQAVIAITDAPKSPPARISLSIPTLLNARQILLHITGDAKKQRFNEAALSRDIATSPIAAFLSPPLSPLMVYWAA